MLAAEEELGPQLREPILVNALGRAGPTKVAKGPKGHMSQGQHSLKRDQVGVCMWDPDGRATTVGFA